MLKLKTILNELIGLEDSEWEIFKEKLEKKEFKAKTTLIKNGGTANAIYFIETGLMRTYYLHDGKEISTYFACDEQFISTFSSFITQKPSFESLDTIENSIVYTLRFDVLIDLYKKNPKFEKLGRILAEKNYLCVLDRTLAMQTKTAKEKYLDFMENYHKKIVRCVPQHMIASFLGIAPESLSRIRKEIVVS